MRALLASLINIAQRTGRFTVAEATDIYNCLWRFIGFAFFACVAAFIANARFGWTTPSLMLAIVFAVVAIYVWAKPLHILVVAGLGGLARRIATDAPLADEVENVFETYLGFLKWVLFAVVTFLFITGTVSFKENPQAILPALVGLSVAGLCIWLWPKLFSGVWARKLVYWYAVAIVVLSFGSLIPGAAWVKYTGLDPATVKPTATADRLYRLDKTARELTDADRAKELERITDKVKRRETLTEEDKKVVAEARRSMASEKPSVSAQKQAQPAEAGTLAIPAGVDKKSRRIPVPFRKRVVMTGNDFRFHCVYGDGSEESFIPGKEPPCRGGDLPFVYATNLKNEENVIAYAYAGPQ